MILTCPACATRYDVPEDAIPAEGRRMQCGDCRHTWMQRAGVVASPLDAPPSTPPATPRPTAPETPVTPEPVAPEPAAPMPEPPEPEAPRAAAATSAATAREASAPIDDPFFPAGAEDDVKAEMARAQERFGLEAALYEETAQAGAPDIQPEPEQEPTPAPPTPEELAAPPPPLSSSSPPDLTGAYGDEEERMARMRHDLAESQPKRRSAGRFLFGLLLGAGLVAAAVGVYLKHAEIAAATPEAAPYLTAYAAWVDQLRVDVAELGRQAIDFVRRQIAWLQN